MTATAIAPAKRPKLIKWQRLDARVDVRKLMYSAWRLPKGASLYHHLEWRFAKLVLENGRLRLSPVESWTDLYEKAWCDLLFRADSSLAGARAYGVCWTRTTFDEPAWRMYGYDKPQPMVRFRSSVRALVGAAQRHLLVELGSWFLARLRYRRTGDLNALAAEVLAKGHREVGPVAAAMLHQKRRAFRFEREVRLLYVDPPGSPARDAVYLPIHAATVITDVMTSPYAKDARRQVIRELEPFGRRPRRSMVLDGPDWGSGGGAR